MIDLSEEISRRWRPPCQGGLAGMNQFVRKYLLLRDHPQPLLVKEGRRLYNTGKQSFNGNSDSYGEMVCRIAIKIPCVE